VAHAVQETARSKTAGDLERSYANAYGCKGITNGGSDPRVCGSSSASAHTLLVLPQLLGKPDVQELRRLVDRWGQPVNGPIEMVDRQVRCNVEIASRFSGQIRLNSRSRLSGR